MEKTTATTARSVHVPRPDFNIRVCFWGFLLLLSSRLVLTQLRLQEPCPTGMNLREMYTSGAEYVIEFLSVVSVCHTSDQNLKVYSDFQMRSLPNIKWVWPGRRVLICYCSSPPGGDEDGCHSCARQTHRIKHLIKPMTFLVAHIYVVLQNHLVYCNATAVDCFWLIII